MLDIRWIRSEPEEVRRLLADRNSDMDIGPLLELDEAKRKLVTDGGAQGPGETRAPGSGRGKGVGGDADGLMEEMRAIGEKDQGD